MSVSVTLSYSTPGTYTWIAPADVTGIGFFGIAGGGAGGTQTSSAGKAGGGGGGAYVEDLLTVTPGTAYTITVGAGGTVTSGVGNQGGNTSFASLSIAGGGYGGSSGGSGVGGGAGAGGTVQSGGAFGNYSGGAGAAGSALTGASGFGGGGGSSGNNGNAGNSAQSPSNSAQQGGTTTAGLSPQGVGGAGGVGSGSNTANSTAGTAPGGGGGGAFRSSSGTQSGSAGAAGSASIVFNTSDPYVVQSIPLQVVASPATFTLAAVASGHTVLFVGGSSGAISGITLGGVSGTKVPGSVSTPDVEVWKWENVKSAPTSLVVTTSSGTVSGAAIEIGNPGTVSNAQAVTNSSTSISLTPAQPVKGQLQIAAAYLSGAAFGSTSVAPGTPWTGVLGGAGTLNPGQVYYYSQPNATASSVSWTASTGSNGVVLVTVNPPASRSAFMTANQ